MGFNSGFKELITYLLTPLSRVLLKKLTGTHVFKKFPTFYGTRKFITSFKTPPLVPIVSQINPVHTLISHFVKNYFNIILPSTPGSSKWSLSVRCPPSKSCKHLSSSSTCCMPRSSHYCRFDHPNNIW